MSKLAAIRRAIGWLDHELAPAACVFCGVRRRPRQASVCGRCRDDLPWIAMACPRCAQPLPGSVAAECAGCQLCPPPFERCIAPLHYEFPVDAAIKAFKFRRRLEYGPAFAGLLLPALAKLADVEALLPVPLHRGRQASRGYNQAAELCRPLARASGLALIRSVRRVRATAFQSGLHPAGRRANLRAAFRAGRDIRGRHVLLVDDVITTGATLRQLAQTLLDAGASRVSALAVARATRAAGSSAG